jgi:hypothetical protein
MYYSWTMYKYILLKSIEFITIFPSNLFLLLNKISRPFFIVINNNHAWQIGRGIKKRNLITYWFNTLHSADSTYETNVEAVLEILIARRSTSAHNWKNSGNDILIIPILPRRKQKTWRKQWFWLRITIVNFTTVLFALAIMVPIKFAFVTRFIVNAANISSAAYRNPELETQREISYHRIYRCYLHQLQFIGIL